MSDNKEQPCSSCKNQPCISCGGTGYVFEVFNAQREEPCSHCKGTGTEPIKTLSSGYEGPIPPINRR